MRLLLLAAERQVAKII